MELKDRGTKEVNCPNCGNKLDSNVFKCINCGNQLSETKENIPGISFYIVLLAMSCFFPVAIIAWLFEMKAIRCIKRNDYDEAVRAKKIAIRLYWFAIMIPIAFIVIYRFYF